MIHCARLVAVLAALLLGCGAAQADPGATPLPSLTPPSVSPSPPSVSPAPPGVSFAPPAFSPRVVVRPRSCRLVSERDIFGRTREVRRCGSARF